ncbi:MAG: hypothetical protein H6R15_1009 [Proteobacteria bacterium]|nr:hypothetical protein [Pseudomonadota bacterium]
MQIASSASSKCSSVKCHAGRPLSDALLFDLYACPSEPERWSDVLDQLCTVTGARSAVVQSFSFDGKRLAPRWSAQDSHTGRHLAPRSVHLASENNPRLDTKRGFIGLNRLVRDEDLFVNDDLALRQLREQLGSLGLGRFIGTLWQIDADTYATIALHRAPGDGGDFSSRQLDQLGALSPHLQQAMRLSAKFDAANRLETQLRRQFDHLHCSMLVCDGNGRVRWMNGSAERLLAGDYALRVLGGRLSGQKIQDSERLISALGAATIPGNKVRYLALGQPPDVLHLALQPLANLGVSGAENAVLIVLTTPASGMPVSVEALGVLFGLTPAESSLVCALVGGLSLDQYAAHRQVSLGTVRGQLKQALAKTGATRQSELVRLVLSSAAAQVRLAD